MRTPGAPPRRKGALVAARGRGRKDGPSAGGDSIAGDDLFAAAFADAPGGLALLSADGQVLAINRALADLLGVEISAAVGSGLLEYVHQDDRGSAQDCLRSLSDGRARRYDSERRYVHSSGCILIAQESGAATSPGPDGQARVVVQIQDVTGRRAAAASASTREARLRLVLEQIPAVVWTTDVDLVFTSGMGRHLGLLRLQPDQAVGVSLAEYFKTTDADFPAIAAHRRALAGESVSFEFTWEGRVFRTRVEPLRAAEAGAIVGTIGVASDMTELREIEVARRHSEGNFRSLAETMSTAAFIFQGQRLVYVNPAAELVCGYSFAELQSMTFWDIARADFRELMRERGLARQRGEKIPRRYEVCIVTKGGEERWVDFAGGTIEYEGAPAVLGTAFDITERKRAEAAVRASEERLRTIFENSPLGMVLLDHEQRLIDCNDALSRMVGYTREEILAMTLSTASHPAELAQNLRDLHRLIDGGAPVLRAERRLVRRNGETGRFRFTATTVRAPRAHSLYQLVMIEDITNQRRSEQEARRHRAELGRVLRLRSMGELAAGLAHELNQPLAAVVNFAKGCVNRLRSGDVSPQEIIGKLDQIADEALRAGSIIKWVQRFLRKESAQREPTDIARLVQNIVRLVEAEARERDIEVNIDVQPDLPLVPLEAVQIEQVVFNLVRNAFDAIAETTSAGSDEVRISACRHESNLLVKVRDSGPGLALGDPERIFEPFYTSKAEGMGLGLSISRSIVESHGGKLWVEASGPTGTELCLTIPLAGRDSEAGLGAPVAGQR